MLAHFMATYGYLAIFVGTLLEGETILVLGGYAAHRGHLSLLLVMVVAFAGSPVTSVGSDPTTRRSAVACAGGNQVA